MRNLLIIKSGPNAGYSFPHLWLTRAKWACLKARYGR